jgi:preprotein translocase subunit SecG
MGTSAMLKMSLATGIHPSHSHTPFFRRMLIFGVTLLGVITKLLIVVNVIVSIMLIFVVLLQRPKSEGLGAAFGGDTASNIFGAQTTNVLVNLTRWLAGIFMVGTLLLSILYSKNDESRSASAQYLEAARKKSDEDKARAEAEKAAKAAMDAKLSTQPARTSESVKNPDPKAPIEATPAKPVEGKPTPDASKPASPAVEAVKSTPAPTPAAEKAPEPAKTPEPAPAETPKAPEPTSTPEAPKAPEPSPAPEAPKPAGN